MAIFMHLTLLALLIGGPDFARIKSLPKNDGSLSAYLLPSIAKINVPTPALEKKPPKQVNRSVRTTSGTGVSFAFNQSQNSILAPKDMQMLLQAIAQSIQRHLNYPDLAQTRIEQGAAIIEFTVGVNGQISAIKLSHSSGIAELDQAAINAVQSSNPVALPIPLHQAIQLSLPVNFSLQ